MPFLIGVLILIIFILVSYLYIKNKIKKIMRAYGFSSIQQIIEKTELENEDLPKSLSSMDCVYLERVKKDFPNVNINELKRMSEKLILDFLNAIQKKDSSNLKNEKIKAYADSKISELKNKRISYSSVKFHKTVLSKYEKSQATATIYLGSSLEYFYQENMGIKRKIQDRYKLEFIYVIDSSKVPESKKVLEINCPNCGSPLKSSLTQKCAYCGTPNIEIAKRVWICNDIIRY